MLSEREYVQKCYEDLKSRSLHNVEWDSVHLPPFELSKFLGDFVLWSPPVSETAEYDASRFAQHIAAHAVHWFHLVFPGLVDWKANQRSLDSRETKRADLVIALRLLDGGLIHIIRQEEKAAGNIVEPGIELTQKVKAICPALNGGLVSTMGVAVSGTVVEIFILRNRGGRVVASECEQLSLVLSDDRVALFTLYLKALLFAKARADREGWRFGGGRERVRDAPATAVRVVVPDAQHLGFVSKTYSYGDESAAVALLNRLKEFYGEARRVPGVERLRDDKSLSLVEGINVNVMVSLEPVGVTRKPADVAEAKVALD